jgi:hypothetical protein
LHRISLIGRRILSRHNRLNWSQRTRSSNRLDVKLEEIFEAICQLEKVLESWKEISHTKETETSKSKKYFFSILHKDGVELVADFICELRSFKVEMINHFLRPLEKAFPVRLPREIMEHIWQFSQLGDAKYISELPNLDPIEMRKFRHLIFMTILSTYNAACKQQTVGSVSLSQMLNLCTSNFKKISQLL